MEEKFEKIFAGEPREWLDSLPAFQKTSIDELLASYPPDQVAIKWLTANLEQTLPFGAEKKTDSAAFLNKLNEEIEAFLCGNPKYNSERKELLAYSKKGRTYLVGVMSVAIAPYLGVSAVFLAPAIVLSLFAFGKMSIHAWCATRVVIRNRMSAPKRVDEPRQNTKTVTAKGK